MLTLSARIEAFHHLGEILSELLEEPQEHAWAEEFRQALSLSEQQNPWFTREAQLQALNAVRQWLHREHLQAWMQDYPTPAHPRTVAVVMAGNIPLVNFHDVLAVLLSGHNLLGKLSSQDRHWMPLLCKMLCAAEPGFAPQVKFTDAVITGFDAVIATGSDNTSRYFEYYFGKYPHIIRRNRSSVALLTGKETDAELSGLGVDIFRYFGLGCRNVSLLLVPENYDYTRFWQAMESWQSIIGHHKYRNNYDYNKAILLVNREAFLDNGFMLLRPAEMPGSPVSVVHTRTYADPAGVKAFLESVVPVIQCIVASAYPGAVPFGQSQQPGLTDYPDGANLLAFLSNLT